MRLWKRHTRANHVIRAGFAVVPDQSLAQAIRMSKLDADLCTSTFSQFLAMELIGSERPDAHVQSITKSYSEKKRLLVEGLRESNLPQVEWTNPEGGMFRWLRINSQRVDTEGKRLCAVEGGVSYLPGTVCYPRERQTDGEGRKTMRLNFASPSVENMEE